MTPEQIQFVAISVSAFIIALCIGAGVNDYFTGQIAEALGFMK